jgi:hypothetical protein
MSERVFPTRRILAAESAVLHTRSIPANGARRVVLGHPRIALFDGRKELGDVAHRRSVPAHAHLRPRPEVELLHFESPPRVDIKVTGRGVNVNRSLFSEEIGCRGPKRSRAPLPERTAGCFARRCLTPF